MSNNDLDLAGRNPAEKSKATFVSGWHNKVGTVLAISTAISLLFPLVKFPYMPPVTLISDSLGKVLFAMFVILAIAFYRGVNGASIKVIAAVSLALMCYQLYDPFYGVKVRFDMLGNMQAAFGVIQWGAYVNLIVALALACISFLKKHQEKKSTF